MGVLKSRKLNKLIVDTLWDLRNNYERELKFIRDPKYSEVIGQADIYEECFGENMQQKIELHYLLGNWVFVIPVPSKGSRFWTMRIPDDICACDQKTIKRIVKVMPWIYF
jgi:hypothetical protein